MTSSPTRALGGALRPVPDGPPGGDLVDHARGDEVQPCEFGGPHGCTHPAYVELHVPALNLLRFVCRDHAPSVLILAGCDVDVRRTEIVVERVLVDTPLRQIA